MTCAGLATRFLGFFYRIYLSNALGARLLGVYQLLFPVYGICFTIFASGIQTAISKQVAESVPRQSPESAAKNPNINFSPRPSSPAAVLRSGLLLSVSISLLLSVCLSAGCRQVANIFLREPECARSLRLLSYAFPFCGITACISGYCYGLKKSFLPATAQLLEQSCRVLFLFLLTRHSPVTCELAILALVIGELCSCVYSICSCLLQRRAVLRSVRHRFSKASSMKPQRNEFPSGRASSQGAKTPGTLWQDSSKVHLSPAAQDSSISLQKKAFSPTLRPALKKTLQISTPLTANRLFISVLHSFEAFLVPLTLRRYGLSHDTALSIFGILSGMTMSFLMFPGTLTNSLSVLLLPAVSEAKARGNHSAMAHSVSAAVKYSVLLGIFSGFFFFFFGEDLGITVFHEKKAGEYLACLSFLCPFLYLSTTLSSILNGLDKMNLTFLSSVLSLSLRVILFCLLIPRWSVYGYLVSLMVSQLFLTFFDLFFVCREIRFTFHAGKNIFQPALILFAGSSFFSRIYQFLSTQSSLPALLLLGLCSLVFSLCMLSLFFITGVCSRHELM